MSRVKYKGPSKYNSREIALIVSLSIITVLFIILLAVLIWVSVYTDNVLASFIFALNNENACSSDPTICLPPMNEPPAPTVFEDGFQKSVAFFSGQVLSNFSYNLGVQTSSSFSFGLLPPLQFYTSITNGVDTRYFGFSAYDPNSRTMYLFFRGTSTNYELRLDFQYPLVPFVEAGLPATNLVHSGFLTLFRSIKPAIKSALVPVESTWDRIVITGHSLGGALSSLVGTWLTKKITNKPIYIYTYGKPRVGNVQYAETVENLFGTRYWRVENTEDIIPQLPIPVMPNLKTKVSPFIYTQDGNLIGYTQNWGGLLRNHSLTSYIGFVKSLP